MADRDANKTDRSRRSKIEIVVILTALVIGVLVINSFVSRPRIGSHQGSKKTRCSIKMRHIGIALQTYHDEYGQFPPAYVADENGTPMHSWRVLLLPYLDYPGLYLKFQFDEPWNSPHNLQLAEPLDVFKCPSQSDEPSTMTNYLAVVGERTCWPGAKSRSKEEIADGPINTVQLIEVADSDILWSEPRDLNFRQMNFSVGASDRRGTSSHHKGVNVTLASGHAERLPEDVSPEEFKAYLTVDGGEPLTAEFASGLKRLVRPNTDETPAKGRPR